MVILRDLGYGKNRLQEIIVEEVEELCKIVTSKEGEVMDICELLKYVKFPTFLLIKILGIVTSAVDIQDEYIGFKFFELKSSQKELNHCQLFSKII